MARNTAKGSEAQPTLLVTDATRGSAISIIRSLGRSGWRVIAADSDPNSLGFRSRYADERIVYPAPEAGPGDVVDFLLHVARDRGVDVLVPVSDAVLLPLSKQRDRFAGICRLAVPDVEALDAVTDKLQTLELARREGVPVPKTHPVESISEACKRAEDLAWPVVLKPQRSVLLREGADRMDHFSVSYAEDPADLSEQMRPLEGRITVLLQEYSPGRGCGVELLMHEGRPLAAFQHERLSEIPVSGGASALRKAVPLDPVLFRHSVRLLEALEWTGLAMVEFKVGPEGPRLMEINGRVWGSLPLAVWSGVDFPRLLAELMLNGPPDPGTEPFTEYRLGTRSRNLELEMLWIAQVLRGRPRYPFLPVPNRLRGVQALLRLLDPTCHFDILSLRDPRPGLAEIPRIARKLRGKVSKATRQPVPARPAAPRA